VVPFLFGHSVYQFTVLYIAVYVFNLCYLSYDHNIAKMLLCTTTTTTTITYCIFIYASCIMHKWHCTDPHERLDNDKPFLPK